MSQASPPFPSSILTGVVVILKYSKSVWVSKGKVESFLHILTRYYEPYTPYRGGR